MQVRLAGWMVLAALLAAPIGARAQIDSREGIALQNQIMELRQQLEALRQQPPARPGSTALYQPTPLAPAAGAGGTNALSAQLLDRVQRLEEAVRDLRGQVDDANNTRQQQYDALNKKIDDLAFRLGAAPAGALGATDAGAEAGAAATAAGVTPPAAPATLPTPPPPPATPAAKRTPELILQEGNAALAKRDYAAAEADAKEVLANGKGPRATDAQFLLAQSLAGRKDWSAAAVAFDDAYNRNRTGSRAPDSLLGLAVALTNINEKRAACETLDKLRTEFPSPRESLKEPIAQARKSAACH